MELSGITFEGSAIDDFEILSLLPDRLRRILESINGFILQHGALHFRGACCEPEWHSLRAAWKGENGFHRLYDSVEETDIPFAQDCVGDQFFLRNGHVIRLLAESDEIENVACDLREFLLEVDRDPEEFLSAAPDHKLRPGELLHAWPPFCTEPPDTGYSIRPCPAHEVILFHAELARTILEIPDGGKFDIQVKD